ncbi:hypothetical protein DACRYDRAFT_22950 [Dacryopinax primogenitus]|uniref:Uncharacterized protein n=1 Tax=Dacryopinax primogenitus (strain DJM 731) TaxID=1858805 RepID=M5GB73_DACPD|nr:uncharacterized protein DACRYDRAFT_22950 [Dacryopinax primogenitus]EJU01208.1 hypothetical protein DACRYDRAFT_22950 [Dacryopinax primogenitus]
MSDPNLPPSVFQATAPTCKIVSNNTSGVSSGRRSLPVDGVEALVERGGLSGTLQTLTDGSVWDGTNGFGSGEVLYPGVDQDYSNGPITHVTTHAIDIFVETDDNSASYFLARGIAPKNLRVDVSIQIPRRLKGSDCMFPTCICPSSSILDLVENKTRESQSPTLPPIISRAAAPYITILPTQAHGNTLPSASTAPVGAIVGGVVGGVAVLVLIALVIFLVLPLRHGGRAEATAREEERVNRPDVPVADASFLVTPLALAALSSAPPEYSELDVTPASSLSPFKTRFSSSNSDPSIPDAYRSSFSTLASSMPSHSRTASHARSVSGGSSGTGILDKPTQSNQFIRNGSTTLMMRAALYPPRHRSTMRMLER